MEKVRKNVEQYLLKCAVLAFFGICMFSRCANTAMPQGGPRDTLPPRIVNMSPGNYSTNFKDNKIYIEFDEYVQLKEQQKEFYTSPFMSKKPVSTIRGRGIQIDIQDTLLPNTTYSLNFGSSIVDNNESNQLNGFRYVFSTGDKIDSMVMSGYTVDASSADSLAKTFIFFYRAEKDSMPDYDSTLLKGKPDFVARAESNGVFIAENLKPVDYRVYAVYDENNNQTYDPGVDRVGFLDSICNPASMPEFGVWYDTTLMYMVADPQLFFRLFKDTHFKMQRMSLSSRPLRQKIMLAFNAEYPEISSLRLDGIDSTQIITEHLKPTRDSIVLWLNVPAENLPDTIKGEISYMRHDSLRNLVPTSEKLVLGWKAFESKQQEKERLKKEREREQAIKEGREPEKEPNPFKYDSGIGNPVNPEKNIYLTFDYPLVEMDSSRISFVRISESKDTVAVKPLIRQDTANIRRWEIATDWVSGGAYAIMIPPGALRNVAGETNDTISSSFTVMNPEKYGTLIFDVRGKTPESRYILQLMGSSGDNVIQEIKGASTGKYTFNYVDAGDVRLRVIEDVNGNGEWDTGNVVERRQPERAERFVLLDGGDIITAKVNWELDFTVDMSKLFAPVTMESLREQLRELNERRVRDWVEKKAQERERERQNRNKGGRSSSFNPSSLGSFR